MVKKILVPLGPNSRELKTVHYALALAERLQARVFLLKIESPGISDEKKGWLDEALLELVSQARQAGLEVSYHTVRGNLEEEIIHFIQMEDINLMVVGDEGENWKKKLGWIKSLVPSQIIQVMGKANRVVHHREKRG